MLRKITVHSENSIRFTPEAKEITQQLNEYRRANGEVSLKEMARIFGLRESNCSNYYYGCLLYTSPSPRDYAASRMPSSA